MGDVRRDSVKNATNKKCYNLKIFDIGSIYVLALTRLNTFWFQSNHIFQKSNNERHEIKITYLSMQNNENFQIPSLFIKRLNLYVQKACYFYVLLNKQVFASLLWNLAASMYNFIEISQGLKPVSYRWVQFSLL